MQFSFPFELPAKSKPLFIISSFFTWMLLCFYTSCSIWHSFVCRWVQAKSEEWGSISSSRDRSCCQSYFHPRRRPDYLLPVEGSKAVFGRWVSSVFYIFFYKSGGLPSLLKYDQTYLNQKEWFRDKGLEMGFKKPWAPIREFTVHGRRAGLKTGSAETLRYISGSSDSSFAPPWWLKLKVQMVGSFAFYTWFRFLTCCIWGVTLVSQLYLLLSAVSVGF